MKLRAIDPGFRSLHGSQLQLDTPSTIFKILAEEILGDLPACLAFPCAVDSGHPNASTLKRLRPAGPRQATALGVFCKWHGSDPPQLPCVQHTLLGTVGWQACMRPTPPRPPLPVWASAESSQGPHPFYFHTIQHASPGRSTNAFRKQK